MVSSKSWAVSLRIHASQTVGESFRIYCGDVWHKTAVQRCTCIYSVDTVAAARRGQRRKRRLITNGMTTSAKITAQSVNWLLCTTLDFGGKNGSKIQNCHIFMPLSSIFLKDVFARERTDSCIIELEILFRIGV